MWPVSQRFLDTLAHSHDQLSYVEILQDGVVIKTIDAHTIPDPITGSLVRSIGGRVDVSRQQVRRSGTIDFLDIAGAVAASDVKALFQPLITEIRPWVGLRYWDGLDSEYVPIGTLVVTNIDGVYPQISVQGYDRMWMVGPFTKAYVTAAGQTIADAIGSILSQQLPASRLDLSGIVTTEHVTSNILYSEQDDAAAAVHNLATAAGQIIYCNPLGVFTTGPESTTDDDPVMTYAPGSASTMLRPTPKIDASNAYNAVVFTSEGGGSVPLRGYAEDTDPNSITYVTRVGVRPLFASSPLITTQAQANLAAQTRLHNVLGIPDTLTQPVIPNPALEAGDVIMVTDLSQNINYPVIIDSFPAAMRAADGAQVLTCRSRIIR